MPQATRRNPKLTPNQVKVLGFITAFIDRNGYPPSLHDIREDLGHASKATAVYVLNSLEAKGHLERIPGVARGLRLLHPAPAKRKRA